MHFSSLSKNETVNRTPRKNMRKRRTEIIEQSQRHGGLLRDILEKEVGNKRGRRRIRYIFSR